jgi:hypothetical protein
MVSKPNTQGKEPDPRKAQLFEVLSQADVPHGRNGKHKEFVTRILDNLAELKDGKAMRIRLNQLPDTKEKIRAALSRAVRQNGIEIVTSTDDDHLYIWHSAKGKKGNSVPRI